MTDKKEEVIRIRLEPELKQQIVKLAKRESRTLSNLGRLAFLDFIKKIEGEETSN